MSRRGARVQLDFTLSLERLPSSEALQAATYAAAEKLAEFAEKRGQTTYVDLAGGYRMKARICEFPSALGGDLVPQDMSRKVRDQ